MIWTIDCGIVSDTHINEHSSKIAKLEGKIEELEEKIKSLEEDEISRIDEEIKDKYDELDTRIDDLGDEYVSSESYNNHWMCSIPIKWQQESEEDENTHPMDYDSIIKQEGDDRAEGDQWSMLWGLTKMDKQIELLEENYNGIKKEQLCSCKTQELLERKINKLETQLIYNQNITVCLFKEIYEKLFPSIIESLDSFEFDFDVEDASFDCTNIIHESKKIKKMINDYGIEDYVESKCNGYINERDKSNIREKLDKCKTLKELTTLALKEGFKQEDIDNAVEKGNTGLTILKQKRNAHSNLYELLYIKNLRNPIDTRVLGLPISGVGPIFNRNLKHLD